MSDVRIVVAGASGRMGRAVIAALAQSNSCVLCGALVRAAHGDLGKDAGVVAGISATGVLMEDDALPLLAKADALIDFTLPIVSVELAALAAQARIVHVIGTTGLSTEDEAKIRAAARHAVIVKSGNMSLGVSVLVPTPAST